MVIFLIGFMGSGKSYIGEKLAKLISFEFIDMDEYIETRERCNITTIFNRRGENYFRALEAKYLRALANRKRVVIATGGGTPCFNENMTWMNQHGLTIYLDMTVAILKERLRNGQDHRPLLEDFDDDALEDFIKGKLEERSKYYSKAQIRVNGEYCSEGEMSYFQAIIEDLYPELLR